MTEIEELCGASLRRTPPTGLATGLRGRALRARPKSLLAILSNPAGDLCALAMAAFQ